jgi:hypothetical protein
MVGTVAKATPSEACPCQLLKIALPRAVTRCFPDLVSRDSNGLVLISFASRAHARNAYLDDLRSRLTCNCYIGSIIPQWASVAGYVIVNEGFAVA